MPSFGGLGGGSSGGGASCAAGGAGAPTGAACNSYTIITTRGTGEMQGPSAGFRTMNSQITSAVPGGKLYNTMYAAGFDQNSAQGTQDIVNNVTNTIRQNPNECFILQGYSQGAAATTNALAKITGAGFDAVKGVVMVGNPLHRKGLACNVDDKGGTSTMNVQGMMAMMGGGVPQNWVSKTLDICAYGDGVCDTSHGMGINAAHMSYGGSQTVQAMGLKFMQKQLGH
ncbi:uncharacterized protein PFL1_05789 [Pseudozyma flocculosa PF-1]|uniref:Cutinase n=1 Tax=Pseudozyma flocculosa PF-1 TaxID=1277687 RepID=A0A061H881_9BASI|nr:uncharacterized protein PFL1_05789 [Pseudozyma flocculosa PF-1]EPQ26811.1 hypothetical protein PFL1_05789 [Pseudozyma flocculosa PF-1]